jgi:hypothetical protein
MTNKKIINVTLYYDKVDNNWFMVYAVKYSMGKVYLNGYHKEFLLEENGTGGVNICRDMEKLTRLGKINNNDYISSACYLKKDLRKNSNNPCCKTCKHRKECIKKYAIKTEKEKPAKIFEKVNWFWGDLFEGVISVYKDKKDLKLEKVGTIKDTRYKQLNLGFDFWKDVKTKDIWISRTPDNIWWKQYKGNIETLKKLDVDKIGNIFTKEIEKREKKKISNEE